MYSANLHPDKIITDKDKKEMKTTIRKTIILFLTAFALAGCSKDDEPCDPNNEESPCYAGPSGGMLLLVAEKQSDFTYKYTYDERNRMVRWDQTVNDGSGSWSFAYDDNDRLIALERRDGSGAVTSQETYTYESDNRPVSGTFSNPGAEEYAVQIQFTYTQNTVTETHVAADGVVGNVITYTFDSNGNIVSEQNQSANGWSNFLVDFGDYDDKSAAHQKWPFSWKQKWINNYQSYKSTTVNGIQDHIYEYTYNDAGYPVKAEVYDRATGMQVATREYTYKKAN